MCQTDELLFGLVCVSLLEKAKAVQVSRMQVAADLELEREVNRNGGFVLCREGTYCGLRSSTVGCRSGAQKTPGLGEPACSLGKLMMGRAGTS